MIGTADGVGRSAATPTPAVYGCGSAGGGGPAGDTGEGPTLPLGAAVGTLAAPVTPLPTTPLPPLLVAPTRAAEAVTGFPQSMQNREAASFSRPQNEHAGTRQPPRRENVMAREYRSGGGGGQFNG